MPGILLKNTRDYAQRGVKVLVYGNAGSGKTRLCSTAPRPLVISTEAGLLTLHNFDIPYVEIASIEQLKEVYDWITRSNESKDFDTICLDSISEIAEVCLATHKGESNNKLKAYGDMQDDMRDILRAFRDINGKNVYFSSKMEKTQDNEGDMLFSPSMPGKTLTQQIPYFFDEVFPLRTEKMADGTKARALQTVEDNMYIAKDRSGNLDPIEEPNLAKIFDKINGVKNGKEE